MAGEGKVNWIIVLQFTKKRKAKTVQDWLVEEYDIPRDQIPITKPEGDKDGL